MPKLERDYQADLIKRIRKMFPGCMILKNNANYMPGVPDLILLYGRCWAVLEVKRNERADKQPNQDYYVEQMNDMSFAAIIYPSNEEEVLRALQLAFESCGNTCVPRG
jgi:hypothetical protein